MLATSCDTSAQTWRMHADDKIRMRHILRNNAHIAVAVALPASSHRGKKESDSIHVVIGSDEPVIARPLLFALLQPQ